MVINEILDDILSKEGGFINHKRDKGGPTNMGITLSTYSEYLGRKVTIEELKVLDKEQAKEIFIRKYFVYPRINTLPTDIQHIMLDTSILFGPKRAISFLQKILNLAGFGPIDMDGILGPQTRQSAITANFEMKELLNNAIVDERILYHKLRVQQDKSQEVFLSGWINRAESYRV